MTESLTEGAECPNLLRAMIHAWAAAVAKAHGKYPGNITYVFCSDDYILQTNREFLQHDYYTDIITFADVQLAKKTSPTDATKDVYTNNSWTRKYNALNIYTNYNIKLGKHDITAMFGFNQERYSQSTLNTNIEGQADPTVPSFGGGTGI